MTDGEDWLFPEKEAQQAEREEKGFIFAQRYLVFGGATSDPRARELLAHWTSIARKRLIADNATLGELAAHNAFARFIEGIHAQIELAQKAQQPVPKR